MKILHKMHKIYRNENGSTAVIVSLSFTLLAICAALVIDLGMMYYQSARYSNAADAAVLAAAQKLPFAVTDTIKVSEAKQTAILFAFKNGVTVSSAEQVILGDVINGYYTSVSLVISGEVQTTFARVIGIETLNVNENAKARIAPVSRVYGAVPFAVKKTTMDNFMLTGQKTHIALKFGGGSGTTGDFGVLDLDGMKSGGANDVEQWVLTDCAFQLKVDEQLYPVETGAMKTPIDNAVEARYNKCTHFVGEGGCTALHYVQDCPRVITVPVVVNPALHYSQIVGFSAFILEPVTELGTIFGSFIGMTGPGVASSDNNYGDSSDYGLYSVLLAE